MKLASVLALFAVISPMIALDGKVGIHDPSTIIKCGDKYYVYGTGGTALVSDDGWTWRASTPLPLRELAPDVIHLGDRYYLYTARNVGAQPKAEVHMISTKSLDPSSPDYKFTDPVVVASSDGKEDSNAIDPGIFRDLKDGRLWLVYGSYFGYIRLVELDPKSGKRLNPSVPPRNLAVNCEASDMMFHDDWYYLLATHGSCCRGTDSGYNIRVGRSRKVTGPFLDAEGIDMIEGGGKLLIGSGGRTVGPGHFGLIDIGDGLQKFSLHWEADLQRGGASVLDVLPLLWRDGWPVAGDNLKPGTYEIESARTGTALELAVEGIPVGGRRVRGPGGPGGPPRPPAGNAPGPGGGPTGPSGPGQGGGMFAGTGSPIASQEAEQVSSNWPGGDIDLRMANYQLQAQQKWSITAVPNGGGYMGSPYFRISIAGTERTLTATPDNELVARPSFTGAPEQLWRVDQLADGSWRITPKSASDMTLSAIGASSASLEKVKEANTRQRWLIKTP